MNLLDAARRLAKAYPGGIEALAQRMGKSPATLRHELAGAQGYKLGAEDLEEMTLLAIGAHHPNALVALATMNANCGQMSIPLPQALAGSDDDCMRQVAGVAKEFSDLVQVVSMRTSDCEISDNDLAAIDKELTELVGSVHTLREALGRRNLVDKAGKLKAVA
jgi:hypothetical protein